MNKHPKLLFMGDSITSLGVTSRGWVGYFNQIIKPSHFENVAVAGAWWEDYDDTVYDGNPLFNTNHNNVIGNQVEKVLRAKASGQVGFADFDCIIIAAGTNGGNTITNDSINHINEQFIQEDKTMVPLENVDRQTWAGAMRYTYEKLKCAYPNASIFYCSPVQGNEHIRPYQFIQRKRQLMKEICDRLSDVIFIDTFLCGICGCYEFKEESGRDLIDGLHPNISGAKKIGEYNAREIMRYINL